MGVEELRAIVVDTARTLAERSRALQDLRTLGTRFPELAWREAVRAPLGAALDELGLMTRTFDEDFDAATPLVDLELGKLVAWALARLRLRCVPVPKQLHACTGEPFRAALWRVTETDAELDVTGSARTPIEVRVTLGPVKTSIGTRDPAQGVFSLLKMWAEHTRSNRRPVIASNLAIWLASDDEVRAAERLGVRIQSAVIRTLDPIESVRAIIAGARIAKIDDDECEGFDDYRRALLDAVAATTDRLEIRRLAGSRLSVFVDGVEVTLELPRMRPRDDRELAVRIFDALATVTEPRLGARPVLAKGDLVVLVAPDEHARLRDAELLA